jgi:hypothetical protein
LWSKLVFNSIGGSTATRYKLSEGRTTAAGTSRQPVDGRPGAQGNGQDNAQNYDPYFFAHLYPLSWTGIGYHCCYLLTFFN